MPKKKEEGKEKTGDIKSITKEVDKYVEAKKEEIIQKIDEQIEFRVNKRMKEEEKNILRGKTRKIICRDIVIVCLLAIIGYFCYCLYRVDYFHIKEDITKDIQQEENPIEIEEYDSDYYIEKYGYLVDNLQIRDEDVYYLYNEKVSLDSISNDLKLKIAYKNLDKDKIVIDEENNTITFDKEVIWDSARYIFGEDVSLNDETFTYNSMRFIYFNDGYIGFKEEEIDINFSYEIVGAKEEDNQLMFEVVITTDKKEEGYIITFRKIEDSYVFDKIEAN